MGRFTIVAQPARQRSVYPDGVTLRLAPASHRHPGSRLRLSGIIKNTTQAIETAPDNAFGVSGATKTRPQDGPVPRFYELPA